MIPIFQKIDPNINYSFYLGQRKSHYFPNPFMFHPEVEILLVIHGTGTRLIGDSVGRFVAGDVVMIGPNVPHVWYGDEKYTKGNSNFMSEVIFILFKTDMFGEQFLNLPESESIIKLIQLSRRGINLTGKTRKEVASLILSISNSVGFKRISLLISILEIISSSKEYQFLSSLMVQNTINYSDSDRLNKIYKYVINNFQQEITLDKISSLASLSTSAFCHYFKKRTNKTFIHFLTEIRIAFACRLLIEEDQPVEKICYTCGYSNVSYFIRQFKEITGLTPLRYKNKYVLVC
jgi:AraC-like DNA-binding protein